MIILLMIFGVVVLQGVKFSSFHPDYTGIRQTTAIKGAFASLIFLSHMNSYLPVASGYGEGAYRMIIGMIGQLMVTMFFFYSGYGIYKSWEKKTDYAQAFFRKRILKILVHFDLAVLLFAVVSLIMKTPYSAKNWLLCWVGWESIGNSNWFIFNMLAFYLMVFVAMQLVRNRNKLVFLSVITAECLIFWVAMQYMKPGEAFWADTVFCFPAGLWYAFVQKRVDVAAHKKGVWWAALAGMAVLFAAMYAVNGILAYSLCAAVFSVLVMWITMRVRFVNPALNWLGKHSFSIYILQRIPMIVFTHFGLESNKLLFIILTFATVFPLSALFDLMLKKVDCKMFG